MYFLISSNSTLTPVLSLFIKQLLCADAFLKSLTEFNNLLSNPKIFIPYNFTSIQCSISEHILKINFLTCISIIDNSFKYANSRFLCFPIFFPLSLFSGTVILSFELKNLPEEINRNASSKIYGEYTITSVWQAYFFGLYR